MITMQAIMEQLQEKGWDGTLQKNTAEFSVKEIQAIIGEEYAPETKVTHGWHSLKMSLDSLDYFDSMDSLDSLDSIDCID